MIRARLLLWLVLGGCAPMRITPPAHPTQPATVYLAQYGRHAGLLLPRGPSTWVEYAYGERAWYAEDRSGWWRVPAVMLWPTQGALGRREVSGARVPELLRRMNALDLLPLPVGQDRLDAVRDRLDQRFEAREDSRLFQPLYGMDFVVDPDDYCVTHQCNQVLAEWLEELGCRVEGCRWFADFDVQRPGPAARNIPDGPTPAATSEAPLDPHR